MSIGMGPNLAGGLAASVRLPILCGVSVVCDPCQACGGGGCCCCDCKPGQIRGVRPCEMIGLGSMCPHLPCGLGPHPLTPGTSPSMAGLPASAPSVWPCERDNSGGGGNGGGNEHGYDAWGAPSPFCILIPPPPPPPPPPPLHCPNKAFDGMRRAVQRDANGPVDVPRPVDVPGSGSPDSQGVSVAQQNFPTASVSGIWITCTETGVTLSSACSAVTFYHNDTLTKHYTTPASRGVNCSSGTASNYTAGSGSANPPNSVSIFVTTT